MAGIKLNGPHNRWHCDGCGKEDWWGPGWSYYGSIALMDTCPLDVPAACSPECAKIVEDRVNSGQYVFPKLKNKKYYFVVTELRQGY